MQLPLIKTLKKKKKWCFSQRRILDRRKPVQQVYMNLSVDFV